MESIHMFFVWDWVYLAQDGLKLHSVAEATLELTLSLFWFIYFYFMHGCFVSIHLCTMCSAWGSQKRNQIPWNCSYCCRCWTLNWGPLEERPVAFSAEPSLALELFTPPPSWMLLLQAFATVPCMHIFIFSFTLSFDFLKSNTL